MASMVSCRLKVARTENLFYAFVVSRRGSFFFSKNYEDCTILFNAVLVIPRRPSRIPQQSLHVRREMTKPRNLIFSAFFAVLLP